VSIDGGGEKALAQWRLACGERGDTRVRIAWRAHVSASLRKVSERFEMPHCASG